MKFRRRVILNNARNERLAKDLLVISYRCAGISFPGDSSQAQNDRTLGFHSTDKTNCPIITLKAFPDLVCKLPAFCADFLLVQKGELSVLHDDLPIDNCGVNSPAAQSVEHMAVHIIR